MPKAHVTWAQDVFGNAVVTATFPAMSDSLIIESLAELQLEAAALPVFDIAVAAISYPFRNADDKSADSGGLAVQPYSDPANDCVIGLAPSLPAILPTRLSTRYFHRVSTE